jgi:hypothetical protein
MNKSVFFVHYVHIALTSPHSAGAKQKHWYSLISLL